MIIRSTDTPAALATRTFDVIVVGAGIAGLAASSALAGRGKRVLLLDKAAFPRSKGCGGCLNGRAVAALTSVFGEQLIRALGGQRLDSLKLRFPNGHNATIALGHDVDRPPMAVSRFHLDSVLLNACIDRGVAFLSGARLVSSSLQQEKRTIAVRCEDGESQTFHAPVVLACDGLGSRLAEEAGLVSRRQPLGPAKVGAALLLSAPAFDLPPREVVMACGRDGYVGIARVEQGKWNVAAALRPSAIRRHGGPVPAMASIMAGVGLHPHLANDDLQTCPRLHRSVVRPWAERLLLVGDSSGYVEPITGEGMAWALAGALGAVGAIEEGWTSASGPAYEHHWNRAVRNRRTVVRLAGALLDRPLAWRIATTAIGGFPSLGKLFIQRINSLGPELP
jgi:flavin-dependent dehydrogenase